jgi:thymidylate synthase (FAD)
MNNTVELIGHYGDDITHALSAWTSTSRDLSPEKIARIPALLKMLADNRHHTPFEKSTLQFLIRCETASHIHCLKHRIGVSCVSGDTQIHVPKSGGGVKKIKIQDLYHRYKDGIISKSSTGKLYRRKYGRPIPIRTKENESNIIKKDYIKNVFLNGDREVFEFSTDSGKRIKCTLDHKFYTPDGFKEIGEYLGVSVQNGIAVFRNKNLYVATNGVELNDPSRPYTFRDWWNSIENQMTRRQASQSTGLKYDLLKKWGYIHRVKFLEDENKNYKKGSIPWNNGFYGYKLNRKKNGINPNINKNLSYKIWRASVGNWTREQLPALMIKYNHVCQCQWSRACSRDFVCHHVIPVSVNKDKATEFNNLSLVCGNCHKVIHSSRQKEVDYADKHYNQPMISEFKSRAPRKGRKLSLDFEKIVSVKYIGVEEVFDLETVGDSHCYIANGFLIHNCNGESARYKELKEPTGYVPSDWPPVLQAAMENHFNASVELYKKALAALTPTLGRARAKESARFFLPYSNQLTLDVSFNWRSFAHFQGLRNKPEAQKEIREIAQAMLEQVKAIEGNPFQHTIAAFGL